MDGKPREFRHTFLLHLCVARPQNYCKALETSGEVGYHALAEVVHAEDPHTIFDLFSQPKVVEGLLSSPSQTWAHYTRGATRGRMPNQ